MIQSDHGSGFIAHEFAATLANYIVGTGPRLQMLSPGGRACLQHRDLAA